MSRWFRLYDEMLDDPKMQRLPPATFKAVINLWCLASKNGGKLPCFDDIAFGLRMEHDAAVTLLDELVAVGLLDHDDAGLRPHNWDSRQYVSDSSAERVKRHREKRKALGLQSQWTAPKSLRKAVYERDGFACVYCGSEDGLSLDHRTPEIRGGDHSVGNLATACMACNGAKRDMTEEEFRERNADETFLKRHRTEQNTEQNRADKKETRARRAWPFEEFWKLFPNKVGKGAAEKAFRKVEKSQSVDFPFLLEALRRYAAKNDDRPWCNPATWLNQSRWTDEPAEVVGGKIRRDGGNSAPNSGSLLGAIEEMRAGLAADKNADVVQFVPARSIPGPEGFHGTNRDGFGAIRSASGGNRDEPPDGHSAQVQIPAKYRGSG